MREQWEFARQAASRRGCGVGGQHPQMHRDVVLLRGCASGLVQLGQKDGVREQCERKMKVQPRLRSEGTLCQ